MKVEAEIGARLLQSRNWGHQKLEELRKDPPLEPLKGAWPCPHFEFVLLASRTRKE